MDNKDYFKYSQLNDDDIVDFSKPEGVLVVNKNSNDPETNLMIANHELIELITTYKTIKDDDDFVDPNYVNRIVDKIIYIIENANLINYSSFCVYLQVVGYSYSSYNSEKNAMSVNDKRELMKQLLTLYIENRHDIYLYHGYSDQVLQVQSDAASSRRKGKTGIEKMEEIMKPLGFVKAKTILELKGKRFCYLLPDKGDLDLFNRFLKENNIIFEFRKTRDNKNPDMLLKINDEYFIVEHKLTNGGGGSQNAEINEIIQFINYGEENKHWHYISCLQGNFFKKINAENQEPKAASQYKNIVNALNSYPQNYFINGKGFEKFINDFTKEPNIIKEVKEYLKNYSRK